MKACTAGAAKTWPLGVRTSDGSWTNGDFTVENHGFMVENYGFTVLPKKNDVFLWKMMVLLRGKKCWFH